MKTSFLKQRIEEISEGINIIVLKGFPIKDINKLADDYKLIDNYVIVEGKIDLSQVNSVRLLQEIMALKSEVCLLTYESFLDLTTMIRNFSAFQKKFCILTNNLLTNYENQTTEDIPDFDNNEFQDNNVQNTSYVKFYSFCMHVAEKQYVQFIEYFIDDIEDIYETTLIEPTTVKIESKLDTGIYTTLSEDNDSLSKILESIYYGKPLVSSSYLIEYQDISKPIFGVLQHASDILNLKLKFYQARNQIKVEIRKDLYKYLEETWGYTSFRDLNMYKDLNIDRSVTKVSQGEIIETVIRQAESALVNSDEGVKNVLLTSPTGAGKSLLFQLSAIYLAEKYKCLTIVISPLVALMNDQVDNLVGNYKGIATLNGNIPPTQKEDIIQKIKDGQVNILYLAPELLLSYSITSFIGDRRIGLFVVDEAHTVTTWGRDFRVDYWFLGDYLRQAKRVLKYSFPIFALTATAVWDPSGKNDMVFDTIRSLNMDPCIKYIGVVRRDDIHFEIEVKNFTDNYNKQRNNLTIQRIHESVAEQSKTIVYFPYKSTLQKILNHEEMEDCRNAVTEYHASLTPAEKNVNAEGFKKGSKIVMCATKAYGMGIDVSDINKVYHHAPTGCLSDYVQEIGRVARDPNITGIAKIDFSEKDFLFTRTLHGLSAIKSFQLMAVLKKLMALYKMKGEKRNMLISSNDFEYIFPGKEVDYDQKVKSCLLLISNDLLNKLRFNAIIVRPKDLFSKAFISVSKAQHENFEKRYSKYIHLVDNSTFTYKVDIDDLWNKHYSNYSFANFKRKVADQSIFKGFNVSVVNRLEIVLNVKTKAIAKSSLLEFFTYSHKVLECMSTQHKRLGFSEIKTMLPSSYSAVEKESFLETFKMVYATENGICGNLQSYCSVYPILESIQLIGQGYERVKTLYMNAFDKHITNEEITIYCSPYSHSVKVAELLNSLNLADYERQGGDKPAIFVRINNPNYLHDLIRKGYYSNDILNSIYDKFHYSEWVYSYFFTNKMTDQQRWDFIEAYFLGAPKEELIEIGNRG